MTPRKLNLGSGKAYDPDYLNVDIDERWNPDIVTDMSKGDLFDTLFTPGWFDEIRAYDVLEHVPNLAQLMTNCLRLLRDGGKMDIIVPYDLSYGAWQDPTHLRAFNERSWLYYTDWHWYLGWLDARFDMTAVGYDVSDWGERMKKVNKDLTLEVLLHLPRAVDSMRVELTKRPTTPEERAQAEAYTRRTP